MGEDRRDVNAVGTGHTILAIGAGHGLEVGIYISYLLEQFQFVVVQRLMGRIGTDIVLQVLHIGHTAEHGEHSGLVAGKAESPRRHRRLRVALLEQTDGVVVEVDQLAAKKGFHNESRYVALFEFAIKVA